MATLIFDFSELYENMDEVFYSVSFLVAISIFFERQSWQSSAERLDIRLPAKAEISARQRRLRPATAWQRPRWLLGDFDGPVFRTRDAATTLAFCTKEKACRREFI